MTSLADIAPQRSVYPGRVAEFLIQGLCFYYRTGHSLEQLGANHTSIHALWRLPSCY